jgi:hypothetical protein
MTGHLSALTLSRISVGFAAIAAVWLTVMTTRGEVIALIAALAVFAAGHAARILGGQRSAAAEWGLAACGMLTEILVYAGIAAGASLHPASAARAARFAATLGGTGTMGVWRLAVIAATITVLLPMVDVCVHGQAGAVNRPRLLGSPGDLRVPLTCLAFLLAGPRAALLAAGILGLVALGPCISDGLRQAAPRGEVRGYRGDGRISMWIGGFVGGRLPPLAPLVVGLLVTGVLAALGLRNLSGILILTPVEAMLLAALASWHPHDGPADWLVPPLIQSAEYVFIAELGFASHLWPEVTFALIAAIGLRHLDLAYRVRGGLAVGIDRRGLGWEGRMILAGITGAAGIQMVFYPALAFGLWWLLARDAAVGWSAEARSEVARAQGQELI